MEVDKLLGQFSNVAILWFPIIQVYQDQIDYWYCIFWMKMGVLTSKNAIKKLSFKIGEYSGQELTSLACLDKLKISWEEYQVAKKDVWALQKTFLDGKVARKAQD